MKSGMSEGVLIDPAIFHDDKKVPSRVRQEMDIRDRVAIDDQQIGERPRLHDAEPARIGIARSGQTQQLAIGARRPGRR